MILDELANIKKQLEYYHKDLESIIDTCNKYEMTKQQISKLEHEYQKLEKELYMKGRDVYAYGKRKNS